jgi:membrane protease YdiL (CAAX protease family)
VPLRDNFHRERVELGTFLLLIVPTLVVSGVANDCSAPFAVVASMTIARDVGLVALVAFFAWSNGEPASALGIVPRRAPRELALGAALFIAMWLVLLGLEVVFGADAASEPLQPHGAGDYTIAVALVAVVAIAEEIIFRGYLLLRLRAITGNTPAAVVIATTLFAIGHAYEGGVAVAAAFVLGLVFALLYLWRRSLVAPIAMHFLQDLVALVLVPALAR